MKKQIFCFFLAVGCIFPASFNLMANDDDLPAADHPFWQVMAQLDRPDDVTCETKINVIFIANGIPTDGNVAQMACGSIAGIVTSMQSGMTSEGVNTNLFAEDDWHHITNLYFDVANEGRIEFTNEVDFMSREFMVFFQTLTERLDIGTNEIELDANIVNGLRNSGAILTMRNVSNFNEVEIAVDDMEDEDGVVSALQYDKENRTIVFNVAHFTSFKAVEKGSLGKKAKIKNVKAKKIVNENGKEKIEIVISGSKFDKKAKVKLGSKKANRVKWKSKYKLVAYFDPEDLKNVKSQAYVKVINKNAESKKYERKIDWKNL